ncbi:MobC family plasmid mobilization relaxosome protein [Mariprofundus erugo]|uniref:MobC family plasmid mobilization relaxosome protein n=1 Tax=Mariprofundus erugo TaxID=2528639 RepID=A0A5R9GQN8_9PROT|nr:plasmid mobilization relaxosome protein MobC [Mariprofundus erugo]TLS66282.1 MobC family plasmid mobilization relaxosome protein [Mariprofundus erugo]
MSKKFAIHLNDEEHTFFEEKAKAEGLSVGGVIKKAATQQAVIHRTHDPVKTAQIARIGNNVNQIARHLNRLEGRRGIDAEVVAACRADLDRIRQMVENIQGTGAANAG